MALFFKYEVPLLKNASIKRWEGRIIYKKFKCSLRQKGITSRIYTYKYTKRKIENISYIFASHNFICFGVHRRPRNSSNKTKDHIVEKGIFFNKNHHKCGFLIRLETNVLIREKTIKNLKKYMQTKEPFLTDVGYNILGEGQQFVDEKIEYAYNVVKWPLQAISMLLNRVNKHKYIREGAMRCHH